MDHRSPETLELIATSEEAFTGYLPGKVLLLGVSADTIRKLKKTRTSLEIVYPLPKRFQLKNPETTQERDRLFILVDNRKEADANLLIFHGLGSYDNGPVLSSAVYQQRMIEALREMGYTLD